MSQFNRVGALGMGDQATGDKTPQMARKVSAVHVIYLPVWMAAGQLPARIGAITKTGQLDYEIAAIQCIDICQHGDLDAAMLVPTIKNVIGTRVAGDKL